MLGGSLWCRAALPWRYSRRRSRQDVTGLAEAYAPEELNLDRRFLWGRTAIALAVALGVLLDPAVVAGWPAVLAGAFFALTYNLPLAYLVRRRFRLVRPLGAFLDTVTVLGASLVVFMESRGRQDETDLWLTFAAMVVVGALYLGPRWSLLTTSLWMTWLAIMTLSFMPLDSYARSMLPMRLVFMLLLGFVGYWLATELRRRSELLEEQQRDTLIMLATLVEARDSDAGKHLQRIRRYCEAIGRRLGLPPKAVRELGYAAMIHDVGKAHVSDAILKKTGPLTLEERGEMQMHTTWGDQILGARSPFRLARQIARWHHERWDGRGYPDGLRGDEIPLVARIVAVADVYDALTSRRPYKDAWSAESALAEMMAQKGKHFDPLVLDAFLGLWREGVIGETEREAREDEEGRLESAA